MKRNAMRRTAVALLLGLLPLSPVLAAGDDVRSLEQIVVEMARTPAHHSALAAHYHEKSEQARHDMRRHESMRHVYRGGKQRSGSASQHCESLSERYRQMASDYEALAELHEGEAKTGE